MVTQADGSAERDAALLMLYRPGKVVDAGQPRRSLPVVAVYQPASAAGSVDLSMRHAPDYGFPAG